MGSTWKRFILTNKGVYGYNYDPPCTYHKRSNKHLNMTWIPTGMHDVKEEPTGVCAHLGMYSCMHHQRALVACNVQPTGPCLTACGLCGPTDGSERTANGSGTRQGIAATACGGEKASVKASWKYGEPGWTWYRGQLRPSDVVTSHLYVADSLWEHCTHGVTPNESPLNLGVFTSVDIKSHTTVFYFPGNTLTLEGEDDRRGWRGWLAGWLRGWLAWLAWLAWLVWLAGWLAGWLRG